MQVFIHNPHSRTLSGGRASELSLDSDISLLSINKSVSSVAAGSLDPVGVSDMLMVGTQTDLLAYDVQNNTDAFYKEVSLKNILQGQILLFQFYFEIQLEPFETVLLSG